MKRIVITGGSGGIGQSTIRYLLDQGHQVINLDLIPCTIHHPDYVYVKVDLGNPEDLESVLYQISKVDGLVLNAVASHNGDFLTQNIEVLRQALEVNVVANVRLAQWFANQYEGTTGRIVLLSSTRARMSEPDTIPYTVSKGALEALTHSLAITLASKHITVNAIAPGWIHHGKDNLRDIDHAFHPSNRVGRPHDIARAVGFLLEEDSQFITGEILTIDGGVTKKMIYPE